MGQELNRFNSGLLPQIPKRQLPRGVKQDSEQVPYAPSDVQPNATILPQASDDPEDGRSSAFNSNAPFAAYRDGKPLNDMAQSQLQGGAVLLTGAGAIPNPEYKGSNSAQMLPGVSAGTPLPFTNIQGKQANQALAQANPTSVPAQNVLTPGPSPVAPPAQTKQKDAGDPGADEEADKKPTPKKRKKRVKKSRDNGPLESPSEPDKIVVLSGSFGTMQMACREILTYPEFVVIVRKTDRPERWTPPISVASQGGELQSIRLAADDAVMEVYFLGIHFIDPKTNFEYIIFNL